MYLAKYRATVYGVLALRERTQAEPSCPRPAERALRYARRPGRGALPRRLAGIRDARCGRPSARRATHVRLNRGTLCSTLGYAAGTPVAFAGEVTSRGRSAV